jgi:hypothetical protein
LRYGAPRRPDSALRASRLRQGSGAVSPKLAMRPPGERRRTSWSRRSASREGGSEAKAGSRTPRCSARSSLSALNVVPYGGVSYSNTLLARSSRPRFLIVVSGPLCWPHRTSRFRSPFSPSSAPRTFQAAAASNCRTAGEGAWTWLDSWANLPIAYGVVIDSLHRPSGPGVSYARSRVTWVIPRTI